MKIVKNVIVGTLESSDCLITASPSETLSIEIESVVKVQYGKVIEESLKLVAEKYNVTSGKFLIQDKGALDFTVKARMETAILRGGV